MLLSLWSAGFALRVLHKSQMEGAMGIVNSRAEECE